MAALDHDVDQPLPKNKDQLDASARGQNDDIQLFDPSDLTKDHIPGASVVITQRVPTRAMISKPKGGRGKLRKMEISYEQFVVGHFLRYVKIIIHDIMKASLKRTDVKNRLEDHIVQEWQKWSRQKTTKRGLLNAIVRFVVYNCPQAKATRIDVVRDFPDWCEQQFGLSASRPGKTQK